MASPGPRALLRVVRDVRTRAGEERQIVVAGARALVPLLARELRAGGEDGAVAEWVSGPERLAGAAALVWIGPADEQALRRAARAGVPIVGVSEGESLPYVLDTDLVRLAPGSGLPVAEIARALARRLGHGGARLAARLPVLRAPVVDDLIASCARQNGLIAAARFLPGADLPVLTLNELRLVLHIALASGEEVGLARAPEVLGVIAAGLGSRRLARAAAGLRPAAGFVVRGAVTYAATRAVGEAARTRFGGARLVVRPGT